ncbi:hypothetical protein SRDD_09970 [Serratia sp. DD3]|nr:hypothetical protein SRDD_09970 [Serratia sp. DD3]
MPLYYQQHGFSFDCAANYHSTLSVNVLPTHLTVTVTGAVSFCAASIALIK